MPIVNKSLTYPLVMGLIAAVIAVTLSACGESSPSDQIKSQLNKLSVQMEDLKVVNDAQYQLLSLKNGDVELKNILDRFAERLEEAEARHEQADMDAIFAQAAKDIRALNAARASMHIGS